MECWICGYTIATGDDDGVVYASMPPKFAHKDCREAHKDTRIAFLEAEGAELKRQRDTYRAYAERLDGEMAALRDAVSTAKLVGDLRARVADLEVALVDSVPRREMTVLVQRISDAEERYSVELAKRESAEAECARLREDIVRRKAMADDNHKTFMIQVEKIENLEAALAAAREEIKKLEDENDVHGQLIANMNSEHGVAKEMEACLWEIQQLEAALAARRADEPDPEWVRRAAEEIVRLELGHDGAEFSPATMEENAPELARRILVAAEAATRKVE